MVVSECRACYCPFVIQAFIRFYMKLQICDAVVAS